MAIIDFRYYPISTASNTDSSLKSIILSRLVRQFKVGAKSGSKNGLSACLLFRMLNASFLALLVASLTACGGGSSSQDQDPVATDLPIVYVKRRLPVDEDGNPITEDILEPSAFLPGAELYLRERASAEAEEILLSGNIFQGQYDIKDLSVSYDGTTLLFAMRAPENPNADDDNQPRWNIWEYDSLTDDIRRIILSDTTAENGEDISPRYLADGRIVFSSTRQIRSKAILLDENKPQYEAQDEELDGSTFSLHIMDPDGTDIKQISFNQSHDLYPTPLSDGRILYLRWDSAGNNNALGFYSMLPDGSENYFVYGVHSQNTGSNDSVATYWQPVEQPDGRILALQKSRESENYGGDLIAVDIENFTEVDQPLLNSTSTESAGQINLSVLEVNIDGSVSPHGLFSSVYPLFDGSDRFLVSWSQCRIQDAAMTEILPCTEANLAQEGIQLAEPLYGLWMYDIINESQQPIVIPSEGRMYTDAVVMDSRPIPTFIADALPGDLESEQVGVLNIRSVYDIGGSSTAGDIARLSDPLQTTVTDRPARFLRIEKAVSMPSDEVYDFDNSAFGARGRGQLMREVVGYAQIEPDGSVMTKVPANVALAISILNDEGKRTSQRHENWIQTTIGGEITCNGCHQSNNETAHGRPDAEPESINPGALTSSQPFPNTNPAITAEIGETMAEAYARINGIRTPSVDIIFEDDWVDTALQTAEESFTWAYADLETEAPTSESCQTEWNSLCRVVINYPMHIQPLWDLERPIFDDMDIEVENNRCTGCHTISDADGLPQIPAAQIDLRANQSADNVNYATSYQELFNQNDEQIIDEMGNLVFLMVESGEFNFIPELDQDGEPVLDDDGEPVLIAVPILVTVPVNPILRTAGAISSNAFFTPFEDGNIHADFLSDVELKLISEWLDLGAQYYNNPFDAPAD